MSDIPPRKLLLPKYFAGQLHSLARLKDGFNGVLLYRSDPESVSGIEHLVEAVYLTNQGMDVHLDANLDREKVLDHFLERNPDYRAINWHTHSARVSGDWLRSFSPGDVEFYKKQLAKDPEFIGMMVSPVHKMMYGGGLTTAEPINDPPGLRNNKRLVEMGLSSAMLDLGYQEIPL